MFDTQRVPRPAVLALGAALLLMAGVAASVLPYTYPTGDDLCRAFTLSRAPFVDSILDLYWTWSGRWFGHTLEFLIFTIPDFQRYYGIFVGLVVAAYVLATVVLARAIIGPRARGVARWLVPLCLFGLYWSGMPAVNQTVYWWTGSIEYQLTVAMAFAVVAWLVTLSRRDRTPSLVTLTGLATAAFLTASMHELLGLLLALVLLAGVFAATRLGQRARSAWMVAAAGTLVGFVIVYMAPGNTVKIENYIDHYGEPALALRIAVETAVRWFPDWIFDPRLLLATFLALAHPAFYDFTPDWLRDRRVPWHLLVPAVWMVVMAALLLGPAWGTGRWVAPRVLGTLYMMFLLGWFATLFVVMRTWLNVERPTLPSARAWTVVLALFALSLVSTGNNRRIANDLLGPLPEWHAAREQRARAIANARAGGRDELVIQPGVPLPMSVGFLELTPDAGDWINKCAADYHGVKSIVEFRPEP